MTWVKLEDGFPSNPKVLAVTTPARYLYVVGLCYASAHLTDGRIPATALTVLHAQAGTRPRHAAELLDAGLWRHDGDTVTIPDYLEHQRSRAQVEAERDAARQRQAKSRRASRRDIDGTSLAEERRVETDLSLNPPDPNDPDPFLTTRERIERALAILASRDVHRRGDAVIDERAYHARCLARRRADHLDALARIASTTDLDPEALAFEIEPEITPSSFTVTPAGPCNACGWDPTDAIPHAYRHSEWAAALDNDHEQLTLPTRPHLIAITGGASP